MANHGNLFQNQFFGGVKKMKAKKLKKMLFLIVLSAAIGLSGFCFSGCSAGKKTSETAEATVYYGLEDNIQDGVILHCFDWTFKQIKEALPEIAKAGFSSVQTSPAQASYKGNSAWYFLYQPNGFYINDSGLGSEEDLKELCAAADKYGIKVIVDVVANHLAGDHSGIDSTLMPSKYWHNYGSLSDYSNRYEITHGDIGMPDLNTEDSYVQNKVASYIQKLKSDGVDGIRWDAAKHISLPSEGSSFWSTVIDSDMYNYGEILESPVDNNASQAASLIEEYAKYMSVTDSSYSSTILNAFTNGKVSSKKGNWTVHSSVPANKIVYWAESHDTYSNHTNEGGWTKNVDQNIIDRAYAIIASRNGATALYFSRPSQTDKDSILVGEQGSTHFTSPEVAAVNHFHNACNGEDDFYDTDSTYNTAYVSRKSGAVLVLGSDANQSVSVKNHLTTPGTYIDEISGNVFTVTEDTISGKIGSTGIAVFYKVDAEKKGSTSSDQ
jgi:alpha-amylase